jgi:peptidyl-prolyl cis-trans isomerase C
MTRNSLTTAALAVAVAMVAVGAPAQQPPAAAPAVNPKVLTVNGQAVYAAEISLMMQNIQGYLKSQGREATQEEIVQVATQRVVEQKLLAQEAKRFGVKPDEQRIAQMIELTERQAGGRDQLDSTLAKGGSDRAQLEQMFREMELGRALIAQQIQPTVEVSDQEIENFYNEHPQDFQRGEQVHARHILIKADPAADEQTRTIARMKADQVHQRAVNGEDFATLAKELSEDTTAAQGGDLGFFEKNRMVPALADAAFALELGQISPVVETQFGYHVIKAEERRPAGSVPLEEAKAPIRRVIVNEKTNVAVGQLVQTLGQGADIVFLDENGQPLPVAEAAPGATP